MGNTYYISNSGNDDFDGKSPETPFRSFKSINSTVLLPGDRVLLRRGDLWNEELILNGHGEPREFVEVGAYGAGERPCIRRSGNISERCVRINNASYLTFSGIEVCNAGAGIVIFYEESYQNRSVYLSDISAHHFFGIYRAAGDSSKNPEWHSYKSPDRVGFSLGICVTGTDTTPDNDKRVLTDFRVSDCEIYQTGGGLGLDWCDHRCCDGSVARANKFGDVLFENINLHDNDVPDVSLTSLFLQCVTGAVLRNSRIDNGAGGAPWGTAAIHLQLAKNILIENVSISNMPHTGVSDECGIDFETDVENCVIRGCTFENNAGSAMEFLCNYEMSPLAVSRGVLVEKCSFIGNNYARLDDNPGQIHIKMWQHDNCPELTVRKCVYTNPEGVSLIGGDGMMVMVTKDNNSAEATGHNITQHQSVARTAAV